MFHITRRDARRLAIAKQQLDGRPAPTMLETIRQIGCLQLDPISHVAPTHELVLWSRLGPYDRAELARLRWHDKKLFEYWAHAASIVLTEEFPLHQWKMQQVRARPSFENWLDENPGLPEQRAHILAQLGRDKAVFSREIEEEIGNPDWDHRWYSSRITPRLLSAMWDRGEVTVVGRRGKQRQWGLLDEFLPEWTPRSAWDKKQVCRYAAQRALQMLGVATPQQIKRHYTRGRYPGLTAVLKSLAADEAIQPVAVIHDGAPLKGEWYIHSSDVALLAEIQQGAWHPSTTLLSPFDNMICDRDRTEQLWDFSYRIEIYVPKAKRQYGYYVLPILHGDRLIGRIDSRHDRKRGVYQIDNVYAEANAPQGAVVAAAVADAIRSLAHFLDAKQIKIGNVPPIWHGVQTTLE